MKGTSSGRQCTHLGFFDDPTTLFSFPALRNHCHAGDRCAPIDLSYQREYCLTNNHVQCPVWQNQPGAEPPPAQGLVEAVSARRRRLAAAVAGFVVVGLVLWVVFASWSVSRGVADVPTVERPTIEPAAASPTRVIVLVDSLPTALPTGTSPLTPMLQTTGSPTASPTALIQSSPTPTQPITVMITAAPTSTSTSVPATATNSPAPPPPANTSLPPPTLPPSPPPPPPPTLPPSPPPPPPPATSTPAPPPPPPATVTPAPLPPATSTPAPPPPP
jgi:hypothetical protein